MQENFINRLLTDPKNFPATRQCMGNEVFRQMAMKTDSVDNFVTQTQEKAEKLNFQPFLPELVEMEGHVFKLANGLIPVDSYSDQWTLNPGLKFFSNTWKHLSGLLSNDIHACSPEQGREQVMVWPDPIDGTPISRPARSEDLLAMKMVMENLSPDRVANMADTHIAGIHYAMLQALEAGIILGPEPGIVRRRDPAASKRPGQGSVPDFFRTSRVFALQWHITQACDLHCRHCYDRTPCDPLSLSREIDILDSLSDFCTIHKVFGQVSFTGGNPLLHPHFDRLYREAADRGFFIGILGNPTTRDKIESLMAIAPLSFYQVSLEGLEPHNDYIRGPGHFQRVLAFLDVLRQTRVYSKVMLTLTRDNLEQVIPLGELLQDRADVFTFNRLSLVGEGANLIMADPDVYKSLLERFIRVAKPDTVFSLKDNLFNILLHNRQDPVFGGCTGYGCGAAFNFVSVLATGEVYACRKFPSFIGDITRQSLTEIYHSPIAGQYRNGPDDCRGCGLNLVCRGCMASAYSHGLDVFKAKDPYCFF